MKPHLPAFLRRALSRAAVLGAFAVTLLGSGAAYADTPSSWEDSPHVSGLQFLIVLFLIPLSLFVLISLLAALPSLVKGGGSYKAGQPWLGEGEWFGGPRGGVESAETTDARVLESGERGGAGARF